MVKKIFFAFIIMFVASTLYAEGNNSKPTETNVTATKANDGKEAAYKLLEVMNYKAISDKTVDFYTNRLVKANSKFGKVENKIKDFYNKYIGWDAVKNDLAALYSKYFTTKELNDITNFYQTETGKKALKTMGKLTLEGQKVIQENYRKHLNELKNILDSVSPKKEATNAAPKKEKK